MTPIVDGKVVWFYSRGLYDGLSLLRDEETESIWNHITGRAVHGSLVGTVLPVANLHQTTVAAALDASPDMLVAISERPIRRKRSMWGKLPMLGERLQRSIAVEDDRRPTMDPGLGVWIDSTARYYSMESLQAAEGVVLDTLLGRQLVIVLDPSNMTPDAFFAEVTGAEFEGDDLQLSDGRVVRSGRVVTTSGERLPLLRPMQLFTRWYGFALTFPETSIYQR